MSSHPEISSLLTVLIPVYNVADYIDETLRSVLDSSIKNFNIIIVENGSDDGTKEYLEKLDIDNVNIVYLDNPDLIEALNTGLNLSQTKYTAILDGDDICHPHRFETQIDFLESNIEYIMVGTSVEYFLDDKKVWKVKLPKDHEQIIASFRKYQQAMFNPTIMFRTEIAFKAKMFNANDLPVPDLGFFFRMVEFGNFYNISNIYQKCRLRNNSFTQINFNEIIIAQSKMINKYFQIKKDKFVVVENFSFKKKIISQKMYLRGIKYYLMQKNICSLISFLISGILQPFKAYFYLRYKHNLINF